jgi:hypothetical protein
MGEQGPRLPEPKAELTEEPLALAHPEIDLELALEVSGEGLAVPEGSRETHILGTPS